MLDVGHITELDQSIEHLDFEKGCDHLASPCPETGEYPWIWEHLSETSCKFEKWIALYCSYHDIAQKQKIAMYGVGHCRSCRQPISGRRL